MRQTVAIVKSCFSIRIWMLLEYVTGEKAAYERVCGVGIVTSKAATASVATAAASQ
jgi:hypothetical protein